MRPPGQQQPTRPPKLNGAETRASGPVFILRATEEGETDDARQGMLHQVEEALASLWLQMSQVGHTRFQEGHRGGQRRMLRFAPCAPRGGRQAFARSLRARPCRVHRGDSEADRTQAPAVPALQGEGVTRCTRNGHYER